jgi:DNA replication protein DnaC
VVTETPNNVSEVDEHSNASAGDDDETVAPAGDEEELYIEPEHQAEEYEQEGWMEALKPIHQQEQLFYENDADYDDLEIQAAALTTDWQEDRRRLGLNAEDIKEIPHWVDKQKESHKLEERESNPTEMCQELLNEKQLIAFNILRQHIQLAKDNGLSCLPQLLLNISGGAGTGKTFWLNAVRALASQEVGSDFVKAAAPSGTAAFLINGETLHSLFYLPIGKQEIEQLKGERLAELQQRFKNVGVLIIDEKSMIGQEIFWMVSRRLKQARPHTKTEPFGGLSVVLLGDWNNFLLSVPLHSLTVVQKNPGVSTCTSYFWMLFSLNRFNANRGMIRQPSGRS